VTREPTATPKILGAHRKLSPLKRHLMNITQGNHFYKKMKKEINTVYKLNKLKVGTKVDNRTGYKKTVMLENYYQHEKV
jgi:hypothetical protein